jgi:FkbM family methyltransferase
MQELPNKTKIFDFLRGIFKIPFFEQLLVKTKAGKKVNSFGYRLIPRVYNYPHPSWRVKQKNGLTFKLDISNYVDHAYYFEIGDPGFEHLKKMVKETWNIMDVGANIGTTALTFAQLVPKGKVIAFEPNSTNFKRLSENASLNKTINVSLNNVGLGHKEEQVKLYVIDDTNPGMNRILNNSAMVNELNSEVINIKRLDDFIEKEKITHLDLIKIDVEGYEFNVLKGAEKILNDFKPVLFIEVNDANISQNGSSAKELITHLQQKKYAIYIAENMQKIEGDEPLQNRHIDILCLPNETTDY